MSANTISRRKKLRLAAARLARLFVPLADFFQPITDLEKNLRLAQK